MEPLIIDFYNEYPHGVNVIEKMNEECDFLLQELDKRDSKIKELIELYNDLNHKIKEYKKEQELKEILREIRDERDRNRVRKKSFSCFN
jgi:uncharacterized protein YdcH (DUF465 family)